VNIFTDINVAALKAQLRQFSDMNKGIIDLIPAAVEAIKQESINKMEIFGSIGKVHQKFFISEGEIVRRVIEEVRKVTTK
jgi:fructose-bisphosphate aldolase class II